MKGFCLFLCLIFLIDIVDCFIHMSNSRCYVLRTANAESLLASAKGRDYGGSPASYKLKNDFRTFLNQCTFQSFLFLLYQMRDVQTVKWVEEFIQPTIVWRIAELAADPNNYVSGEFVEPDEEDQQHLTSNLLRYHGLGAINMTLFPTWEDFFLELLTKEKEVWTISSTKAHIPEYELEINPASLCSRMISVREQIAREWVKDLDEIACMSRMYIESYWDKQRKLDDGSGPSEGAVKIGNLLFLEWDPNEENDYTPSPLRKGNFDLLSLLTTQEAVHRLINNNNVDDYWDTSDGGAAAEAMSNLFLEKFYTDREESHFSGAQRYSRSDDFLNELLATPPSKVHVDVDDEGPYLIDPLMFADLILKKREEVALEWKEVARASPDEHFGIRKEMLNILIGAS